MPIILRETEEGFALQIGAVSRTFIYPHISADKPQKSMEQQRKQLAKLGNTDYEADTITLPDKAYFIPIGVLNEWRRAVVADLE